MISQSKNYQIWFKLNDNSRISIITPVGEPDSALIKNSMGQVSFGAPLIVSALNIWCSVADPIEENTTPT